MQGRLQARFEECLVAEAAETTQEWLQRMRQDRIRRLSQSLRLWQQQLCMRRCSRIQRKLRLRRSLRHWRRSSTSHSCKSGQRLGGAHDILAQENFVARLCFARDFALLRGVVDAWSSHRPVPVARTPIAGRWRSKGTATPTKATPSPVSKPPRIPLGSSDKENQPQGLDTLADEKSRKENQPQGVSSRFFKGLDTLADRATRRISRKVLADEKSQIGI